MANTDKDTIYIDVDDEITTVIDKVRSSKERIVALVLPKRATTFQSSVNMKLLKRTADEAKKRVVLITSEAGLIPLAAAAQLFVAPTLQSKPEIPTVADTSDAPQAGGEETVDMNAADVAFSAETAGNRPVGELAAGAGLSAAAFKKPGDDIETLDIENGDEAAAQPAGDTTAPKPKPKKDKKLRVPNFERFRVLLVVAILLLIALGVGAYYAATVLPKADIMINTNSSSLPSNISFTLDPSATALDPSQKIVPAEVKQEQKSYTQQVPATGQKNEGDKASGTITITNCSTSDVTIPAGTGFSANGHTYISQSDADVPQSTYSFTPSGFQCNDDGTATVHATAQQPGADYNQKATSYTIANGPNNVTAQGDDMTGGTDKMVTIVSQGDIDSATKKITAQNSGVVQQDLAQQLQQDNVMPITATFTPQGDPKISTDAQVGDQAKTVTVTETLTYVMSGVAKQDLKTLVDNDVKQQIDPSKQSILTEGLDNASFKVDSTSGDTQKITMQTTAVAGPDLNVDELKKEIEGKKGGEVQQLIQSNPGVTNVVVKLSPFWVTRVPSNPDKITINLSKPAPVSTNGG